MFVRLLSPPVHSDASVFAASFFLLHPCHLPFRDFAPCFPPLPDFPFCVISRSPFSEEGTRPHCQRTPSRGCPQAWLTSLRKRGMERRGRLGWKKLWGRKKCCSSRNRREWSKRRKWRRWRRREKEERRRRVKSYDSHLCRPSRTNVTTRS